MAWQPGASSTSDDLIRAACFAHLKAMVDRHGPVLPWEHLNTFPVGGSAMFLANRARGIFWPKQLGVGALSLKTTVPRSHREARYEDIVGEDP